jgi:hypothetical protein
MEVKEPGTAPPPGLAIHGAVTLEPVRDLPVVPGLDAADRRGPSGVAGHREDSKRGGIRKRLPQRIGIGPRAADIGAGIEAGPGVGHDHRHRRGAIVRGDIRCKRGAAGDGGR